MDRYIGLDAHASSCTVAMWLPFFPSALKSNDLALVDDTFHYVKTLPENPGFVIQTII